MDDSWYRFQVAGVDANPLHAAGSVELPADGGLEGIEGAHTVVIPGWRF
ncbi:MAG: hypothetical protein HOI95_21540 [Chromatiales bacterium]|jgi:AraC family transcriptional regulator, transcriptional activator FtrA|nr:hypothetical protein [Chromatiales bacterium]